MATKTKVSGELLLAACEQRNARLNALATNANETHANGQAQFVMFVEMLGKVLQQAYEEHLHVRGTGWRKWCDEELDFSYRTADRIREASLVILALDDVRSDQLPQTMGQCLLLAKLGDDSADGWKMVLAENNGEGGDIKPADIKTTLSKVPAYAKALGVTRTRGKKSKPIDNLQKQIESLSAADRKKLLASLTEGDQS